MHGKKLLAGLHYIENLQIKHNIYELGIIITRHFVTVEQINNV
jgi:hypothetical protein